jgi:acyl-CoA synthetase (NDP forming)
VNKLDPDRLDSLFRPRSVALVGASDKSMFSQFAYRNLVESGFGERTYLVNRRGTPTHGQPTVRTCAEIGEPVDVAFMMVPQAATLDALSDAAAAGITNVVVLSAGYAESGPAGIAAEAELLAHAQALGMVVLGPNHLGFANFVDQIPVTAVPGLPRTPGPVALLSQSGASSSSMLRYADMAGVGLSYLVTLGNEAMVTAAHALDFCIADPTTLAVAMFIETIRDPELFGAAARRAARAGKAVVVLKAGSSELSAKTAAAHTGALVGDDRVIDTMFRELGVIRVDTIEDMILTAGAAAQLGRLERPGVGVVSISGGACDIIADRAQERGMHLPALATSTRSALTDMLPSYARAQNPLDLTGAAILDPALFDRAITAMSADASVGVVAVVDTLPWQRSEMPFATQKNIDAIGNGISHAAGPVVLVNQVVQPITEHTRQSLDDADVPYAISGLSQAVTALSHLAWWSQVSPTITAPAAPTLPPMGERTGPVSEVQARQLLTDAAIPTVPARFVTSADEAVRAAAEFGSTVAVKIVSPDILHKSDIGGVRLHVEGEDAVRHAYTAVTTAGSGVDGARIDGVLVSPMRSGGIEILVGVQRDPQWGLILAVALGGIFVEILDDSVLASVPVSADKARTMLEGLRGARVLAGARGRAPADLDALAEVISRVSDLCAGLGDSLQSLEINPLRVDGTEVEALDALITWRNQ